MKYNNMNGVPIYKDTTCRTEERIDGELMISDRLKVVPKNPRCKKIGVLIRNDAFANCHKDLVATPTEDSKVSNNMQRFLLENTRMGISMLSEKDINHCHLRYSAIMFPSVLNEGAAPSSHTWNRNFQY